jgi:hypothetical protein
MHVEARSNLLHLGIPTLYHVAGKDHHPILPSLFSVYYENVENAEVPIPQNYHAVIGNPKAKSQSDVHAGSGAKWFCEGDKANEHQQSAAFPTKTCSGYLQTLLYFHDCVDTTTLKSAYSGNSFGTANKCPRNMKRMPRLRYSIRYDLRKMIPGGWNGRPPLELTCGSSYCTHGDFIMGWVEDAARNMLKSTGQKTLVPVSGSRGPQGSAPACKPRDRDPHGGTNTVGASMKQHDVVNRIFDDTQEEVSVYDASSANIKKRKISSAKFRYQ